jgi:hypothetical protein
MLVVLRGSWWFFWFFKDVGGRSRMLVVVQGFGFFGFSSRALCLF